MHRIHKIELAAEIIYAKWDYFTTKYSKLMFNNQEVLDEVWDFVEQGREDLEEFKRFMIKESANPALIRMVIEEYYY